MELNIIDYGFQHWFVVIFSKNRSIQYNWSLYHLGNLELISMLEYKLTVDKHAIDYLLIDQPSIGILCIFNLRDSS